MGLGWMKASNFLRNVPCMRGTSCWGLPRYFWMVRSEGSGHGREPGHGAVSPCGRAGAGRGISRDTWLLSLSLPLC